MTAHRTSLVLLALLACGSVASAIRITKPQLTVLPQSKGADATAALPVVMWHGMGDSSDASWSMGAIKSLIEEKLGVYVHSIATGKGAVNDIWSSYFGSVNDQVAKVCEELRTVPELAGGYIAIGFSQGGQFIRAMVERCQHTGPAAKLLITMGAQHQGVANVPGCDSVPFNLTGPPGTEENGASACKTMQALLGKGAYLPWVRDHVVQAQYFKDPARMSDYLKLNPFLPDVNNEVAAKRNPQYASNLASLDQAVFFRFLNDTTVVPRDSSWFSFWDGTELIELRAQALYKEDWLGLRQLDEAGKLKLLTAPGAHMQFTLGWFEANVVWPFLAGQDQPQKE